MAFSTSMENKAMYDITHLPTPVSGLLARLLGKILVGNHWMSTRVLEQALADHHNANKLIAEVLSRMGVLDAADLDAAFSAHCSSMPLIDAIRSAAGTRQLLGNILVENGNITHEQLDFALNEQKQSGELLGAVLIRRGYIKEKELDAVLTRQLEPHASPAPAAFSLGDILMASGHITRVQLNDALEQQKHSTRKIGELLVDNGYLKQNQVEHGLRLQHILVSAALGTFMALYPAVEAEAGGSSAGLYATASVKKSARVTVLHQQPHMEITGVDVARGFLEVTAASRAEVRNSSMAGYMITFEVQEGPFRNVFVNGLGTELQISFGNGWMIMPHSRTPDILELSYRFILAPDLKPGTYPWPIQIHAMAI